MLNLAPYASVLEKDKTMDFSEINVVYDIKAGKSSQINKNMNLYEYQKSRSFIDLGTRSHRFFFSLETARLIEAKFHVEPSWDREWKWVYKWFMSHDQDGRHAYIW